MAETVEAVLELISQCCDAFDAVLEASDREYQEYKRLKIVPFRHLTPGFILVERERFTAWYNRSRAFTRPDFSLSLTQLLQHDLSMAALWPRLLQRLRALLSEGAAEFPSSTLEEGSGQPEANKQSTAVETRRQMGKQDRLSELEAEIQVVVDCLLGSLDNCDFRAEHLPFLSMKPNVSCDEIEKTLRFLYTTYPKLLQHHLLAEHMADAILDRTATFNFFRKNKEEQAVFRPFAREDLSSHNLLGSKEIDTYPPRPNLGKDGVFSCPYCGEDFASGTREGCRSSYLLTTQERWHSHVLEDIGPYACTFQPCWAKIFLQGGRGSSMSLRTMV